MLSVDFLFRRFFGSIKAEADLGRTGAESPGINDRADNFD